MGVHNIKLIGSGGVNRFECEVGPFKSKTEAAVWLREQGFKSYRDGWLRSGKKIILVYDYDVTDSTHYQFGSVKRVFAKINLQHNPKVVSFIDSGY